MNYQTYLKYTAVGLAKYSQYMAKYIPCDNHLHKHDVTKHK